MNKFATTMLAAVMIAFTNNACAEAALNDLEIAHAAYTADVIDIDYAKLALTKTKNAQVREFAELMIRDHTAVNDGAGALLKKLGVQPLDNAFSQALVSGAKTKTSELSTLESEEFDRAYAANELAYHGVVNKTVADSWIPTVQTPELKAFLSQALVTFKTHEEHAGSMVSALK
jgi:putative membrane protein